MPATSSYLCCQLALDTNQHIEPTMWIMRPSHCSSSVAPPPGLYNQCRRSGVLSMTCVAAFAILCNPVPPMRSCINCRLIQLRNHRVSNQLQFWRKLHFSRIIAYWVRQNTTRYFFIVPVSPNQGPKQSKGAKGHLIWSRDCEKQNLFGWNMPFLTPHGHLFSDSYNVLSVHTQRPRYSSSN